MRKNCLLFCFIPLLLLALISCTTTQISTNIPYDVTITSENNSGLATISAEPSYGSSIVGFSTYDGLWGIGVTIENNTDKVVRIIWEESSISYANNSYLLFIDGQKYSESNSPMTPTTIPAKGKDTRVIFSSAQPHYKSGQYGGWSMGLILDHPTIVLAVEGNGLKDFYTIKFTPKI